VSDDGTEAEVARLITEVRTTGEALPAHVSTLGPDALMATDEAWRTLARAAHDARLRLLGSIQLLQDRISVGDASAVDRAFAYLRTDPYYFRSGYSRNRLVGVIAQAALTDDQRAVARTYVLLCVDGVLHCGPRPLARLARVTADNPLRRELRSRLRRGPAAPASRALRMLANVRHPGLTDADRAVAQQFVIQEAGKFPWLTPDTERLARWLWTPSWEDELRDLVRHHDPNRAGAKRLLAAVDTRRTRRPGP
jgi:hypothetical protein